MITDDDNRDGITISSATETLPQYIIGTPPSIASLRKRFDEARADPNQARVKAQGDRDYYDGPKQLSSEVRSVLRGRSQPPIYTNRIRPAVNGVLGVLEQAKSDPQAYPRNPDDQDSADVCTKVLRFIADQSDFGDTKQDVAENFLIEGIGAVIVEMDGEDIAVTQIRWEEFYYDPYSRRNDFLDARYMGIAKWVDADLIQKRWGARVEELGDPLRPEGASMFSETFEDRGDQGMGWINTKRRRVLLIEEYANMDGEWKRLVYIASGVLEFSPSPYLDDHNRPCNPIVATSCYVDRDNGRYGIVRDMVPIQDEINASRSRSLHLMSSRQVQRVDDKAPPVRVDEVREEAAKADGVIPMGWQIISTNETTQANMVRMQEAKGEIERMGPTPAALGRQEGAGQSGRARLVSQQAGLTELARPIGRLGNWELRAYRRMWECARQFKTDPWYVRVTDDVRAPEFLQVNEPVMGMVMQPQQVGQDEMGQPIVQNAPTMGVTDVKNRLADLDIDIILDTVQDTANLAQEVWAELVQLVGQAGGLQVVYTPAFELMVEASPIADKTRVIELIKRGREEQEQSQVQALSQQVQQLTQALEQKRQIDTAETAATIEEKQASVLQKTASAHKTAADADRTQAETYAALGINPLAALAD